MFLPFPKLLRAGLLRRLDPEMIHAEVMVQLAAFSELFGRAPDFVDGHQHAQLFPQVRDAFLRRGEASRARRLGSPGRTQPAAGAAARRAQGAGARHPERAVSPPRRARRHRLQSRPSPAPMIFRQQPDFGALMRQFLDALPDGGLVMCHPGFVDDILVSLDPLDRAARTRTRLSRRRAISRHCWRRIKLHWVDTVRQSAGRFVAYRNLIRPATTCDTNRPYICSALRREWRTS